VPITRQQQPLQVLPKATPLGQGAQAIIEPLGVLLEWPRRRRTRQALGHGGAAATRPSQNSGCAQQSTGEAAFCQVDRALDHLGIKPAA
jgi:hypothetical protein